ncbi:MAG TPA: hypothetical protein PLK29_07960, partial [Chiayiivirga sp.]|nr:hypothetical protein [Chiayiivirga sp.]
MPRTFALARSLAFVFFVSAMLPASVRGQDISLAKTVGTVPATCAATTSIAVPVGTTVYYCYRVTNSGSTVFNFHDLVDSDLGTLLTDHPEVLGAGASVEFIQSAVPAATVTNTATWTAKTALGSYAYDDTVPFSYVSINGSGAPLGLADDGEANIVSPFPITFYGVTSTDLRIGNNGGILFNATSGDVGFANQALPSAAHPLAILPFWDDMGAGGNVYWEVQGAAPNRTLIVEWYEKPHYSNVGASTFEVIFHEGSSDIVFQYQDVDFGNASYDGGASATIGLNQDGTTALQYSFNTASVSAGKAIRFHQVVPTSQTATASATVTVQAPDIDVSPASLAGTQATNTTTTQTLTLANNGTAGLNWTIDEENLPRFPTIPAAPLVAQPAAETVDAQAPAAAPAAVPGGGRTWLAPAAVLYDNGAFVTHPGGGAGGADLSMLDTSLGGSTYGFGHAVSSGLRIADDFTVPAGGWTISQITFFAYQTGSTTTSTMNALNLRIWDGVPGAAGSNIVFGDTTTNRMTATAFSGAYRATDTDMTNGQRPIMATTAAVGTYLPAGTYWVDWQTGGTLASGPWSIPVTIAGQTQKPGSNAVQWDPSASTWNPVMDTGNNTQQDQAFVIEGTAGAPACFTPVDATWLSVSPASGLTAAGNSAPVTVTFDSTGLALGTYTANLCVNSDDPDAGP